MNTFTDTDLTVLDELDFAADCDRCKREAKWTIAYHLDECKCPMDGSACTDCLGYWRSELEKGAGFLYCLECETTDQSLVIDRIEAL